MSLTIFGLITVSLGLVLMIFASTASLLVFLACASLFGGSAAISLTALGNSSVPPANVALLFLMLRCMLPGSRAKPWLGEAVRANAALLIFVTYGVIAAFLLPRVFAGVIDVTPLRPDPGRSLFAASPLHFSNQNVTVAVYMISTLLTGVASYAAILSNLPATRFARVAAIIAVSHAFFGMVSIGFLGSGAAASLEIFRNGFYAQVNQSSDGFVRMNGVWAEPAVYAAYGFIWLVLVVELWLRNVEPRWTGFAAFVLGLALVASTSTTSYVGLVVYSVVLGLRLLSFPAAFTVRKSLWLGGAILMGVTGALGLSVFVPDLAGRIADLLAKVTIDKAQSESGMQRAFWAKQGLEAFSASYGLGVGPGSFRSSSLITAILGGTGVIGIVSIAIHLLRAVRPFHPATYRSRLKSTDVAVGAACSWTAWLMLVPASLSAPSPDPGLVWGLIAGAALAYRRTESTTRFPRRDQRYHEPVIETRE